MAKGKPADPLDPNFLIEHAERLTTSEGVVARPPSTAAVPPPRLTTPAYHAATGAVAQFLFGESWLAGVRWIWSIFQDVGGAKDDLLDAIETLRSLKVEREIAPAVPKPSSRSQHSRHNVGEQRLVNQTAAPKCRTGWV